MSPAPRRGSDRRAIASRSLLAALTVGLLLPAAGCVRVVPVDPDLLGSPALTSVVLAADGSQLTTLHAEQDRTIVPLARIPQVLASAVIAAEDRRFFEHKGVDVRGVARAAVSDVKSGRAREGGSTITQQLVKNTLVGSDRTIDRKIREASLAVGLEKSMTKAQILERYLNTVYFGQGAYGVGAAIRVYFGHGPDKVSIPEAALLAGLVRSPNSSDPIRNPKQAKRRRAQVLQDMVDVGLITAAERDKADRAPLPKRAHKSTTRYPAAYAVSDAIEQLRQDDRLGATQADRDAAIYRGGLTIKLTIDPAQQRAAEAAVASILDRGGDPNAALASVKPGDGAITAMVGGRDFFSTRDPIAKVNLARGGTTKRQAGSTLKVFTIVAALEAGIGPEQLFESGASAKLPRSGGRVWEVDNYDGSATGKISMRAATEKSVNTAFARIVARLGDGDVDDGAARVVEVAERFGVRGAAGSALRIGPSTTLGSQEVDPVEMAAAYATLAAGGMYAPPYIVGWVKDSDGRFLIRNVPKPVRVLERDTAVVATDLLRGVVARGTGTKAAIGRPQAGKTGTSSRYHDAWFVGYTPDFAAAVWVGVARRQVAMTRANGFRSNVTGGSFPAQIWRAFASSVLAARPKLDFPAATDSLVEIEVDTTRGCLPNEWTPPALVKPVKFVKGLEPRKICDEPHRPDLAPAPNFAGLTREAALKAAKSAEVTLRLVPYYGSAATPGIVIDQVPAAGTPVRAGAVVTARVAGAPGALVAVPLVVGLLEPAASQLLADAGLRPVFRIEPSCTGGTDCAETLARDAGKAWQQDVPAGSNVRQGTTVTLVVQPAAVPDLRWTPAPGTTGAATPDPTPSAGPGGTSDPSASPTAVPQTSGVPAG